MNSSLINCEMTKEAVIAAAHNATAVPGMIALYCIFGVVLFLSAWGFKERDTSWGRFFWIWASTMLGVGVFLVFFVFSPGAVQWIADFWKSLWI